MLLLSVQFIGHSNGQKPFLFPNQNKTYVTKIVEKSSSPWRHTTMDGRIHFDEHFATMHRRAMAYNNMAVLVYNEGCESMIPDSPNQFRFNMAWVLCKGALELYLAVQKSASLSSSSSLSASSSSLSSASSSVSFDEMSASFRLSTCSLSVQALRYIEQADQMYHRAKNHYLNQRDVDGHGDVFETLEEEHGSYEITSLDGVPVTTPATTVTTRTHLQLFATLQSIRREASLIIAGVTIIFNLAALEHHKKPLSTNVCSICRLGLSLVSQQLHRQ